MSSPATDTYLLYWRNRATRVGITLALIEIATPSAVTLRVATREVTTPDGNTWEAGLKADPIRARVGLLDPGPSPADCSIILAPRLYPFMSSGVIGDTLSSRLWQGATVTLYHWNDYRDSTGAQVLAWADALCVFESGRVDSYELTDAGLKLNLLQDQSWNNPVPPTIVDKIAYPNAPDVSQGRPVPIVYGDHRALPMRAPWTATYTNKQDQENAGAGLGVVPGLLVDPGLGADHVKVVFASHACADILARASGYTQFIVGNDVLAPLDTTGITETLGASESYITIDDDTLIAYYGVRPLEPRATYNLADNARRAADPFDETSFASLDQGASKGTLELSLPSVASLGYIEAVTVNLAFAGDAGNTHAIQVRPKVPGGAAGTAIASTLGQSQTATPVLISGTWDAAYAGGQTWQFGGTATGTPWDIVVEFAGGTTNVASVLWVALLVKYRPQRSLVTPAFIEGGFFAGAPVPPQTQGFFGRYGDFPIGAGSTFRAARLQAQGQFFANIKGYADDGSGTYTGSASALIERPCDIAHHFLVTYGELSGSDIETGASDFGSFVSARAALRDGGPTDYKLAAWIGQKTSVQQVLRELAAQSLSCILLDRFSGQWHFYPWRRGPAVDYDLALTRAECPDLFECGVVSDVGLVQGVRVRWGYDYFKNRTMFETFVNSDGSSQGYALPTQRDQKLVIEAGVNDDLDWEWSSGPTTYADVLTAGNYTPIELAEEVRAQMRTHQSQVHVGFGFHILSGFNDDLDYTIGATPYVATLTGGAYTAAELAAEVSVQMSSGGHGITFTCTYDHATNKFSLSCSSGTATIDVVGSTNYATCAMFVLGWNTDFVSVSTAPTAAPQARYKDRFWFWWNGTGGAANYDLLFGTGASASTNCAHVLGFDRADADAGAAQYGDYTRGNREADCASSETLFGPRSDNELLAGWVRDEASAQRLRDGVFDFGSTPLAWVRFRSHACPDIQQMRVVSFSSDMDERRPYPKYGSDGSWANKAFRVLEVLQDNGPSYHTEVYAVEA